jgi:hypothetical protein
LLTFWYQSQHGSTTRVLHEGVGKGRSDGTTAIGGFLVAVDG